MYHCKSSLDTGVDILSIILMDFFVARDHFGAAERFNRSRPLRDEQHGRLDGGETPATLWALSTTTNRTSIILSARINHSGILVTAVWTVHHASSVDNSLFVTTKPCNIEGLPVDNSTTDHSMWRSSREATTTCRGRKVCADLPERK